ncbi:DUF1254 domain-containing protein [Psychromonas aquimarina]|uniref:DUF1254 domain-containing protein n=1 Tax=Psychromonas aquimarina TaxID=444919 RepID=UPI00040CC3E6|nr:DUF1254 domain-containing protein [Psychromonas aquimarina]
MKTITKTALAIAACTSFAAAASHDTFSVTNYAAGGKGEVVVTEAELHAYKAFHHLNYKAATAKAAGGTNTLIHTRELPTEGTDPVVTPALDHLYTKAIIDLTSGEPVVLEMPVIDPADRYFSIQIMDAEHYTTYDEINPQNGLFVFVHADWENVEIPAGAAVLKSNGDYPHLFIRTQVKTNDDYANAHAVQNQVKLTGQAGELNVEPDNYIQFTLDHHNVHPQNAGLLESVAGSYSTAQQQRLISYTTNMFVHTAMSGQGSHSMGFFGGIDSKEERADSPVYRALGIIGHLGLPTDSTTGGTHAFYTGQATNCSDGKPLIGGAPYTIKYDYSPAIDSFWSVTRYSSLTRNTLPDKNDVFNSYNTTPDADGKISVTFSAEDPKDGTYWMPVNAGEPYYIVERLYEPRMSELVTQADRCAAGIAENRK